MGNQAAKRNLRVEAAREKPNLRKARAKMTRRNKDRQRNQSEDEAPKIEEAPGLDKTKERPP